MSEVSQTGNAAPLAQADLEAKLASYPTKAELRETLAEELSSYPTKVELRETLAEELSRYPTKVELRETLAEELSRYPTKVELHEELGQLERRFDTKLELWGGALIARMGEHSTELRAEMARLLGAGIEQFQRVVLTSQEPYRDLPARVARLEAKVFPPRRARRR